MAEEFKPTFGGHEAALLELRESLDRALEREDEYRKRLNEYGRMTEEHADQIRQLQSRDQQTLRDVRTLDERTQSLLTPYERAVRQHNVDFKLFLASIRTSCRLPEPRFPKASDF